MAHACVVRSTQVLSVGSTFPSAQPFHNLPIFHRPDDENVKYLTANVVSGMCMEKRVFYRVVSGLHAAINVHVASHYPRAALFGEETWGPNTTLFERFFHPDKTFGEGKKREAESLLLCPKLRGSAAGLTLCHSTLFLHRPKLAEECLFHLLAGRKKRDRSNPFESVMNQGNALISTLPPHLFF